MKTKRPILRPGDRVDYRGFSWRVSSVSGRGTRRDPWQINLTDDAGTFTSVSPDQLERP